MDEIRGQFTGRVAHPSEAPEPTLNRFRRNKKPISCEPCRIAKTRCDHAFPTCDRCARRKIVDKCFYHPAPLTRKEKKGPRRTSFARAQETHAKRKKALSQPLCPAPVHQDGSRNIPRPREWDADSTANVGFLGSTSFMSVFPESPEIIVNQSPPSSPMPMERGPQGVLSGGHDLQEVDLIHMLRSDFDSHEQLILEYYKRSNFTVIPAPLILQALTWTKQFVKPPAITTTNLELGKKVSENSKIPMHVTISTTFEEFLGLYSGQNCRWEFIGLIFALSGFSAIFLPEKNPYKARPQGRPCKGGVFASDMLSASDACIATCARFSIINEILIWLRYSHAVLASHVLGDMNIHLYRRFGELVSDLFALGFHNQRKFDSRVPFFVSETRKRVFASVMRRDKSLATYLGRPSLIHRFQCNFELPLDLEDTDIFLTGQDLDAVLRNLDGDDWNLTPFSNGDLRPATVIRIRYRTCILRENVLDLSLGPRKEGFSEELRKLLLEAQQIWGTIPSDFRYETSFWSIFGLSACLVSLAVYLEYTYSVFQIQRILRQENPSHGADLLWVSMQMLSAVVDLTKQKGCKQDIQERYSHVFVFYGLPSAGVLAYELRDHTLAGRPLPASVSRSSIIRNLTVFVSWFENPAKSMTRECELCFVTTKVISRILDETLNYDSTTPADTDSANPAYWEGNQPIGVFNTNAPTSYGQISTLRNALGQSSSMLLDPISNAAFYNEPSSRLTSEEFLTWLEGLDLDTTCSTFDYGLDTVMG